MGSASTCGRRMVCLGNRAFFTGVAVAKKGATAMS